MAIAVPDVIETTVARPPADAAFEGSAPAKTGAYGSIVVPYDGSSLSHAALAAALALAGRCGASVTLMHAVEPVRMPAVPDVPAELALSLGQTDGHAMLNDAAQRVRAAGVPVTELLVMPPEGEPPSTPQAILTALRAVGA
ncbi:MAG TPA: universal stress protein, partial [Chloroflexota bacterium]|nr:universal stress protein [Chloroflexota bacterium]